jgi:hypothetical protein
MGGLYPSDDCEVSLGETPFSGHLFRRRRSRNFHPAKIVSIHEAFYTSIQVNNAVS